jgi:hypothetical protein
MPLLPTTRDDQPHACLSCGAANDAATGINAYVPSAGDVSICLYCAALAVFTGEGLAIRAATPAELEEIQADAGVTRARFAILRRHSL